MLSNVRVLDATRLLPGPFATWLLAGMGADVVKVEQPPAGDYMRAVPPLRDGTSVAFSLYNAGKRSVALNLKHAEGRAAFLDLAAGSDVVIEGNRPGVMDRLGCGFEDCRARNPSVVYCAVTGFGQDGPYRDRAGHDLDYLAYAGMLSGIADGEGRPVPPRGATIADMAGGFAAASAVLAAVLAAREGRGGRFVDVSMLDAVLAMTGLRLAAALFGGESAGAEEASTGDDNVESGVYETSDGRFVAVEPYEARFKDVLWAAIEHEGAGRRPARGAPPEEVRAALGAAFRTRTRARWDELLTGVEACYAPVYDPGELAGDPHLSARGALGDAGGPPRLAEPARFTPSPAGAKGDAPVCGADTAALLAEAGWAPERIGASAAEGAIGAPMIGEVHAHGPR